MKKLISLAIVALMLVAMAVPAFAFEGTVAENTDFDVVKGTPTLDGTIADGEWGAPLFSYKVSDANDSELADTPNASNTMAALNPSGSREELSDDTFTLYAMWDKDYLYLGMVYVDADEFPYFAGNHDGSGDQWKNDTFQIRMEYGAKNQGATTNSPWADAFNLSLCYDKESGATGGRWHSVSTDINNFAGTKVELKQVWNVTDLIDDEYHIRTCEFAIPLEAIKYCVGSNDGVIDPSNVGNYADLDFVAGDQIAISICCINCDSDNGTGEWAQWFQWGGGICGPAYDAAIGGNNQLTLVEPQAPASSEEAPASSEEAPASSEEAPASSEEQPTQSESESTPSVNPPTGDAMIVVVAVAIMAIGTALVVKKVSVR